MQTAAEVYPRTGGGNAISALILGIMLGLSPHGRGKRHQIHLSLLSFGSIPARAGETKVGNHYGITVGVYPRTGGGNALDVQNWKVFQGLSPHGRGKPMPADFMSALRRSIPARAGETSSSVCSKSFCKVYPRTGGGNALFLTGAGIANGLSPHGRGKRYRDSCVPPRRGSIPARAGETMALGWISGAS